MPTHGVFDAAGPWPPVAPSASEVTPGPPVRAGLRPRRVLPRGDRLPPAAFGLRHRSITTFAWTLAVAAAGWTVMLGRDALHVGYVIVAVALLLLARGRGVERRAWASSLTAASLITSTATLVHVSGGLIEMHFLFFVIVAAISLYQQWAPFTVTVVLVAAHHGVMGVLHPHLLYNHAAAWANPGLWALVHAGFLTLAALVGLTAWRLEEQLRADLSAAAQHPRAVLDSVADAVLAVDHVGAVVSVNARAVALLGRSAHDLLGLPVHEAIHPGRAHPAACPLAQVGRGARSGSDVASSPDLTTLVPVHFRISPVPELERVAAVLTLTDATEERRAARAEERLAHVTAELRVERAEVASLITSVLPRALAAAEIEVAARYLPASGALIGGDLYDWYQGADGTVHMTVVDAMGKGVGATHQAIAVMHTLRVMSLEGYELAELLVQADTVLSRHDANLSASAALLRYDPRTGVLQLATAGHPPPLIVRANGRTEFASTMGVGLGVPAVMRSQVHTTTLGWNDAVVMYTDGLIEGTRDWERGMDDLAELARQLVGAPADHVAERLVNDSASVATDDDRVVVVLRRPLFTS